MPDPDPSTEAYPPRSVSNGVPSRGSSPPERLEVTEYGRGEQVVLGFGPVDHVHRHRRPRRWVDALASHRNAADGWDDRTDGRDDQRTHRTDQHGGRTDREARSSPERSRAHDGQSGTSHSAPSGGRVSVAEAGWPCRHVLGPHRTHVAGAGSAVSSESVFTASRQTPANGSPTR